MATQKELNYVNDLREWVNNHPTASYQQYIKARDELREKYKEVF